MEPNEDRELRDLLKEWQAPPFPSALEQRVFGGRNLWWRASVRLPAPIACCLALLMTALLWQAAQSSKPLPPRVVIRTERVEVPVLRERIVTKIVLKNRPLVPLRQRQLTFTELRPVPELRLKIVRQQDAKN